MQNDGDDVNLSPFHLSYLREIAYLRPLCETETCFEILPDT